MTYIYGMALAMLAAGLAWSVYAMTRWPKRKTLEGPHLMLDVETLGLGPTSALLQIGAVVFDMRTGRECERVVIDVEPEDCTRRLGATVDDSTLVWWKEQGGFKPAIPGMALSIDAAFRVLLASVTYRTGAPIVNIWACGTDFDIALLNWYARRLNIELPWKFWQVCDVRTVETLAKASGWQRPTGSATHRADEDCSRQIINLRSALAHLQLGA